MVAVFLDDHPLHSLRFPLPVDEPLTRHVCELVERYETIIDQSKPARTQLVKRNVIDSLRINAYHLPICPLPLDHELLPDEGIDCVACALDYDVNALSMATYILRVQGTPGIITAELYLTAAPKALGLLWFRISNFHHLISSLGEESEYRQRHPNSPATDGHASAKDMGARILHFLENAVDVAAEPLQEQSARARLGAKKGTLGPTRRAEPLAVTYDEVESAPAPVVKRRGEQKEK